VFKLKHKKVFNALSGVILYFISTKFEKKKNKKTKTN